MTGNGSIVRHDVGAAIERVLITGDLSQLSSEQRVEYYNRTCESLELNPLTRPFEYIVLNGKLTLYARKDCTDQLRKQHDVSIRITAREKIDDVYVVTAQATTKDGRTDESIGAVPTTGKTGQPLTGDNLANAIMKAETKSKRRVTLSICGLGMTDEAELDTIPDSAKRAPSEDLDDVVLRYTKQIGKAASTEELEEIRSEFKSHPYPADVQGAVAGVYKDKVKSLKKPKGREPGEEG
jgi:hypothetical protein